ncbi:oligosaccharide flippase family protein [bacterium]|nr:oligosaccharide flippase family protein [bacterium]
MINLSFSVVAILILYLIPSHFAGFLTTERSFAIILIISGIFTNISNIIGGITDGLKKNGFNNIRIIINWVFFLVSLLLINHDLKSIAAAYLISGLFSLIISLIIVSQYKQSEFLFRPVFRRKEVFEQLCFKKGHRLGLKFMIIQIAVIVTLTTDKLLIFSLEGDSSAAIYDLLYKLYSPILLISATIAGPLWSFTSEAYSTNKIQWIQNSIRFRIYLFFFFVIILIFIGVNAENLLHMWLNRIIAIDPWLNFSILLFFAIMLWNSIYSTFLNAVNSVNTQYLASFFIIIFNVPISYTLAVTLNIGNAGVVLGSCIVLSVFSVLGPLQAKKILYSK